MTTRMYSMNLADKGIIEFPMTGLAYDAAKNWANYPMGVIDVFEKAGHKATHGFDILITARCQLVQAFPPRLRWKC